MSNKLEYTGTLIAKKDLQTFKSGFTKREFVLVDMDEEPQYRKEIAFELFKDKTKLLDSIPLQSKVTVHFNLNGNYYEPKDRHYVSLVAWRIEVLEKGDDSQPKGSESFEDEDKRLDAEANKTDDVPF